MSRRTLGKGGMNVPLENLGHPMLGIDQDGNVVEQPYPAVKAGQPSSFLIGKKDEPIKLRTHLAGVAEPLDVGAVGAVDIEGIEQAQRYMMEMKLAGDDPDALEAVRKKYRYDEMTSETMPPGVAAVFAKDAMEKMLEVNPNATIDDLVQELDAQADGTPVRFKDGTKMLVPKEGADAVAIQRFCISQYTRMMSAPGRFENGDFFQILQEYGVGSLRRFIEEKGLAVPLPSRKINGGKLLAHALKERDVLLEMVADIDAGKYQWLIDHLYIEMFRDEVAKGENGEIRFYDDMKAAMELFDPPGVPKFLLSDQDYEAWRQSSEGHVADVKSDIIDALAPVSDPVRVKALNSFRDTMIQGTIGKNRRIENLKREVTELDRKIYQYKAELVGLLDPFIEFCRAVRGYDKPLYRGEPGAQLMAMGRIFVGQDDVKLEELSSLLECVDSVREFVSWEMIAPNAEASYRYLAGMFEKQSGNWLVHFSRSWARDGFPSVELGHKTAAALMFTDGDPSVAIDPPWRAFLVKVPDGLVTVGDYTLARVLVWYASEEVSFRWWLQLHFRNAAGDWVETTGGMKSLDQDEKTFVKSAETWQDQSGEKLKVGPKVLGKTAFLASRLVAGACMLVTGNENLAKETWHPRTPKDRRRPPGIEPPVGTRWIITKNIEIDLRDQVNEFISGRAKRKGAKITVQFTVRGHRRNQSWGPRHTLRKEIWIKPYFKGDPEAVALLRGYQLRQADAAPQPPQDEPEAPAGPTEPSEDPDRVGRQHERQGEGAGSE